MQEGTPPNFAQRTVALNEDGGGKENVPKVWDARWVFMGRVRHRDVRRRHYVDRSGQKRAKEEWLQRLEGHEVAVATPLARKTSPLARDNRTAATELDIYHIEMF